MKNRSRIAGVLGAVLVAGIALLTAAPAFASAVSAPRAQAGTTLQPPTLTSATLVHDSGNGDYVKLLWAPSQSAGVTEYAVYANGKFLFEGGPYDNQWGFNPQLADVFLAQRGLKGTETFTVTARDSHGDESARSAGLVASPVKTLPAPTLTSAVIKNNQLMLTWTASHTDEVSGNIFYRIHVDNGPTQPGGFVDTVLNQTTATTATSFSNPNDPTVPTVTVTKDSKISIQAEDLTTAVSPLSNVLMPTDG